MIKKKINRIEFFVTEPSDNAITMGHQYEDEILGKGPLYQKLKKEEEEAKKENLLILLKRKKPKKVK